MNDKTVYQVITYNLIGDKLYTFRRLAGVKAVQHKDKNGKDTTVYVDEEGSEWATSHLFTLTTDLNKYPKDKLFDYYANEGLLPYIADVTEDLPSHVKFEPKTYKNCKLMSEKHGSYLQFWHKETKEVLRIAMNSNIYSPVTS